MSATISSINYCPVKSVSFQMIESCKIKKNIGKQKEQLTINQIEFSFYNNSNYLKKSRRQNEIRSRKRTDY